MHVIDELFHRNAAWALTKTRSDPTYVRRLATQQTPRFLWIGCSDSRVPANEIVGLDPGELFVHRNIADVMHTGDLNLLSVLEFTVNLLEVEHIIICGHYGCGGIRRALTGQGSALVDHWLAPVVDLLARERRRLDPIEGEDARPLQVHGWIYGLKDGLVRDLGVSRDGIESPRDPTIPMLIDPTPIDDWYDHIRDSAIQLLESGCSCRCALSADIFCEPSAESAE